jgi:multiple sugar transport system substrate-binding protein
MTTLTAYAITLLSMLAIAPGARAHEPVILTFAAHYTDTEMAPLTACFHRYEAENPGIRIACRQTPIADFMQIVMASQVAGASPDIYNVYSI